MDLENKANLNKGDKEANELRELVLDYCTQLYALLRRGEYTKEDKEIIENFVSEDNIENILSEFIHDRQIRNKLMDIRFEYKNRIGNRDKELGNLYEKYNVFERIKNLYRQELSKGCSSVGIQAYDSLLAQYINTVINPIHSLSTPEIWSFINTMSPDEYKGSSTEKMILKYVEKCISDPVLSRRTEAKNHVENYVGYLISNGLELDFDNDPVLKCIPENELESEKKRFLTMSGVITGTLDGIMPNDSIDIAKYVIESMKKKSPSMLDKKFAEQYLSEGYFDTLMQSGLNDKETRDLVLEIRSKFMNHKDMQSKKMYIATGANTKILELLKFNIFQHKEMFSTEELKGMVEAGIVVSKKIDSPVAIKMIHELREVLPLDEYMQWDVHDTIIKSATSYDGKLMPDETRDNLALYTKMYMLDTLNSDENGDVPRDKLQNVNILMGKLLENIFENSHKVLSISEREAIAGYFNYFYTDTLNKSWNLPETDQIFDYLIKIQKHSLAASKVDGGFIKSKFSADFSKTLQSRVNFKDLSDYETDEIERYAILLSKQGTENAIPVKACFDELKSRGEDIYSSKVMSEFLVSFVDNYQNEKSDYKLKKSDETYEIVLAYINNVTSRADFKLHNEQGLSDILQLISAKRIPEKYSSKINEILENNLKISQIDPKKIKEEADAIINKYTKYGDDKKREIMPITDEQDLDTFLGLIDQLKLSSPTLKVPTVLNKFVIAQTLYEDSAIRKNPDKYQNAVERAVEDFSFNDVEAKLSQFDQRKVCYFTRDSITRRTVEGECGNGRIKITRKTIQKLARTGNISALETALHENTHAEQRYDLENGKYFNYNRYIMDKEDVIRDEVDGFYHANYAKMFVEIEAREQAATRLAGYLKTIGVDLSKVNVLNGVIHDDIIQTLHETSNRERAKYELGEEKVKSTSDGTKIKVAEFFDEFVASNPKILKTKPILRLEYNPDGTLKTPFEICDYAMRFNEKDGKILARNILLKGNSFKKENLARDIIQLAGLQAEGEMNTAMLGLVVADNITRLMQEIIPDIDQMPQEELLKLKNAFDIVGKVVETGENEAFISGFARRRPCRPNEKNAQDYMTEANEKINDRLKEFSPVEIEIAEEERKPNTSPLQLEDIVVENGVIPNKDTKDEEERM